MHRSNEHDGWVARVRETCRFAAWRLGVDGQLDVRVPIGVDLILRFPRPRSHFHGARQGQLRAGAPILFSSTPDKDNVEKAVLDGLGAFRGEPKLIWQDDRQVALGQVVKLYAEPGTEPRTTVRVYLPKIDEVIQWATMVEKSALPENVAGAIAARRYSLVISDGESIEIARNRAKLSHAEFAALLGMPAGQLMQREKGKIDWPVFRCGVGKLAAHEWCLVMRRRAKLTIEVLSHFSGFRVSTIKAAERGDAQQVTVAALVVWWENFAVRYIEQPAAE